MKGDHLSFSEKWSPNDNRNAELKTKSGTPFTMEITSESSQHPQKGVKPISPGARIGHVHLKVANIDRALGFYSGVLGFEKLGAPMIPARIYRFRFGWRLSSSHRS